MLVTLRQFGLFAVPVGQQARQMATDPAVRAMSGSLADDLDTLSPEVRAAADRLGVVLPSEPSGQQRAWSARISGSSGTGYDRAAVDRLRSGCAAARAAVERAETQTHDEQVHRLAEQAAAMLDRHLWSLDHMQPTP
jgi:predicted outer membrane protein